MLSSGSVAFPSEKAPHHRLRETLADFGTQAAVVEKSSQPRKAKGNVKEFEVGDEVLVAHSGAFNNGSK